MYYFQVPIYFNMHRNRRVNWGITHSLTPKISSKPELDWDNNHIPELPQRKKTYDTSPKNNFNPHNQRSRKHRLLQQKNTQIQKRNRMLYEKIKKIMQKGKSAQKKSDDEENKLKNESQFKPLSLPQVSGLLRSTRSQLTGILSDRSGFAEKYFEELEQARNKLIRVHTEQIGKFECFGWKVKALLLNHGQFIVLKGIKGKKKQVTKKYIYEKVRAKIQKSIQEWVRSKFQFQI